MIVVIHLPTKPHTQITPSAMAGFLLPVIRGGVPKDKRRSLGDASKLLPFDHAASDTTNHLMGLVTELVEVGWLQ